VIFFALAIDGLVEQLGHMKAIDHPLGIRQQGGTRLVVRRPHIHAVAPYLFPLRRGQFLQAFPSGRLIAACLDGQDVRLLRLRQIRQNGDIQFVAFLQADLVHPRILAWGSVRCLKARVLATETYWQLERFVDMQTRQPCPQCERFFKSKRFYLG
jgi:hypothetical protein